MNPQSNRVAKLEECQPTRERQFVAWIGNPWTPEQKAEAIRRRPEQLIFWRSLLETPEDTARKMADPATAL